MQTETIITIAIAAWVALSALAAALPVEWQVTRVLRAVVADVRAIAEAISLRGKS